MRPQRGRQRLVGKQRAAGRARQQRQGQQHAARSYTADSMQALMVVVMAGLLLLLVQGRTGSQELQQLWQHR